MVYIILCCIKFLCYFIPYPGIYWQLHLSRAITHAFVRPFLKACLSITPMWWWIFVVNFKKCHSMAPQLWLICVIWINSRSITQALLMSWRQNCAVMLWKTKVTQISKLKLVFLKNSLAILNQSSYESLKETKNENKTQMRWVTWLTWPPCPYMVKTSKIFFSRSNRLMTLKLCM